MTLRFLFAAAFLPAALATSFLAGYSTGGHFSCIGTSCPRASSALPESALPALLDRLSSPSSSSGTDLPFSSDISSKQAPELILVVHSAATSAPSVILQQLSSSAGGDAASSFVARTLLPVTIHGKASPVAELTRLAGSEGVAMFADGKPDVFEVSVAENEVPELMNAIHAISPRANGDLAILWTGREEAAAADDGDAKADDEGAEGVPKGDAPQDPKDDGEGAKKPNESGMHKPEISEAGVAGLVVGFVFFALFVPGFMCLWNIQPPQTFEMIDSSDMKKKMQ